MPHLRVSGIGRPDDNDNNSINNNSTNHMNDNDN